MVKFKYFLKRVLPFVLCAFILAFTPFFVRANRGNSSASSTDDELCVLDIWQVDSFEGGKGSRSTYLESIGKEFSEDFGCYVKVTALTSDAVRKNIEAGLLPDMISYGAGMTGLENVIRGSKPYYTWCNGGYCYLTLDQNATFEDITADNTIINAGTENLAAAAALFCGLDGAQTDKPTGAYVKLINGAYKYLLGTQRDIYRLKTRNVSFNIEPITVYNDLYQNISVTATSTSRITKSEQFIEYLLSGRDKLIKIGLMAEGTEIYDDEMHIMENKNYEYKLRAPVSESAKNEILSAIKNKQLNVLKNLLK